MPDVPSNAGAETIDIDKLTAAWLPFMQDNRELVQRLSREANLSIAEVIAFMQLKTLSAILLRCEALAGMKQAELMQARETDRIVRAH